MFLKVESVIQNLLITFRKEKKTLFKNLQFEKERDRAASFLLNYKKYSSILPLFWWELKIQIFPNQNYEAFNY